MKEKYLGVFLNFLKTFKPTLTDNVKRYNFDIFKKDLIAGLTVSAILIPNAMGYAILVGLPPVMGLYAAMPAVLLASLWGSSTYVITAPVGVVSLLVATSLSGFAAPNTAQFITLAISLSILVGIIQFALGFFKLGVLARLIPHSALVGFTNAAAILIALSQLPLIFGVAKNDATSLEFLWKILSGSMSVHFLSFFLGVATICLVLLGKKYFSKIPISLFIIIGAIVLGKFYSLSNFGINLIGYVPSGLPQFSMSAFSIPIFYVLLKQAFLIALVGFVETYSIAQALAKKRGEKINADKELTGQGVANVFSGLSGGFPVSASFSASALNFNSGAKTSVAGVVVSAVILLALLLLGPFLSLIPKPVLAGIVVAAVLQLVNFKKFKEIYKISRIDGVIAGVTAIVALLIKPDDALFIGIGIGISYFVLRSMNLKITEVGIHKTHNSLWARDSAGKDELYLSPDKIVLRVDYSILFANADLLENLVFDKIREHEKEFSSKIRDVVLNCGGVNYVDLSGIEAIENLQKVLEKENIKLSFMLVKNVVFNDFKRAGILKNAPYIHGMQELNILCGINQAEIKNT
jgi:SulP family sulfate permease